MNTLIVLCRTAGEFLGTRIRAEWTAILRFVGRVRGEEREGEKRGRLGEGRRKWEACVEMLCAVVRDVGVGEVMFGDVVGVLGSEVWERREVGEALGGERGNAEWVWLVCYLAGKEKVRGLPKGVNGLGFVRLDGQAVA